MTTCRELRGEPQPVALVLPASGIGFGGSTARK